MSEKITKKNTTAEATQKNAEAFEKALKSAKAEYTKREAKVLFNVYANVASVSAKHVRLFLKEEALPVFKAYAEANTKNAEAKSKEAKNEAQKKSAERAKQNAEAFADSVKNADTGRKGIHTVAITVTEEAYKATAEALAKYAEEKKQKKAEADEAKQKQSEEKKQNAEKKSEADSKAKKNEAEKKNEEAKNAAK